MSAYPIAAATEAIVVAFAARGLTITREAARQWVTAEQGENNNILGVTYATPTGRSLYRYRSLAEGARAAADLVARLPAYAGLRAALRPGVSTGDQLAALIASPWNRPNSPYYRRMFLGETTGSPTIPTTEGPATMTTLPTAIRTNVSYVRRLVGNQNPPILGLIDPYLDKIDDYAARLETAEAPAPPATVAAEVGSPAAPAAPETEIDLSAPSNDTTAYTRQLWAIEGGGTPEGEWPSEATDPDQRRRALVQFIASIVAAGPAYYQDPGFTLVQVRTVKAWADADPGMTLNPVIAAALERAAATAPGPDGRLPWPDAPAPVREIDAGTFGIVVVSGPYGNPDVE